jgi:hypothetical protein
LNGLIFILWRLYDWGLDNLIVVFGVIVSRDLIVAFRVVLEEGFIGFLG